MSLINQMLRDLEQRRTTEMGPSPLGGLSASGSATQTAGSSVNYMTLAIVVAVVFASGVMVAYLLSNQQQTVLTENTVTVTPEKKVPDVVADTLPKNTKITALPTMVKSDPVVVVNAKIIETVVKKPVAEKIIPEEIKPNVENINKTIHPLTDEQQSQLAFQRALHMLARNNQQDAQMALEEALSFSPIHLRARETLAAILLNTGRMSEAATHLNEGLHLLPNAAPLAKLYARILVDQGDTVAAIAVLERASPAVASDSEYHALLAALYQQVAKYAQAARIYQQILSQRPEIAQWWMGLALAQDAMGEASFALDAFQRAQRAGGLSDVVLKYVQARIIALTPVASMPMDISHDLDEFEE